MLRSSFKRVFEFILRAAPEVTGKMSAEVPGLRKRVKRLLQGTMTEAERDSFFQAVRLNPQAIQLLAKEIQRKTSAAAKHNAE